MNDETKLILSKIDELKADLKGDIGRLDERFEHQVDNWSSGLGATNTRIADVEKTVSAHGEALAGLKTFRDGLWGKTIALISLITGLFWSALHFFAGGGK